MPPPTSLNYTITPPVPVSSSSSFGYSASSSLGYSVLLPPPPTSPSSTITPPVSVSSSSSFGSSSSSSLGYSFLSSSSSMPAIEFNRHCSSSAFYTTIAHLLFRRTRSLPSKPRQRLHNAFPPSDVPVDKQRRLFPFDVHNRHHFFRPSVSSVEYPSTQGFTRDTTTNN